MVRLKVSNLIPKQKNFVTSGLNQAHLINEAESYQPYEQWKANHNNSDYQYILEPPVTVRLTKHVILSRELAPLASVCLSITNCPCISLKSS